MTTTIDPMAPSHCPSLRRACLVSSVALSLFASACSSSDSAQADSGSIDTTTSTAAVATTEPTAEVAVDYTPEPGRLRVTFAGVTSLDPAFVADAEAAQVARLMFEPLVELDADLNLMPGAASSWSLGDDGVTWTFVLRDDGAFSNGQPVTTQNFVYAFARGADPDVASPTSYQGTPIVGWDEVATGEPSGKTADEPIAGVTAIDDYTLQIVTSSPFALLPALMTFILFAPVPEGYTSGEEGVDLAPIGNGPYVVAAGDHEPDVLLEQNPKWTGEPGKSSEILFKLAETPEISLAAFEAGEVDIARYLPPEEIERLRASAGDRLVIELGALLLYLDVDNSLPPFDDVRYRKALSMAIDREVVVAEGYNGLASPAFAMVPPGSPGALIDSCEACMFNAVQAQALFAEAGGVAGDTITLSYAVPDDAAAVESIAQSWRDVLGLEVTTEAIDFNLFLEGKLTLDGPVAIGWVWDYPSGYSILSPMGESETGVNLAGYSSPAFDELMDVVRSSATVDDTFAPLQEAQTLIEKDLPIIPFAFGVDTGVYSERVTNVRTNAALLWQLEDVEIIN